MRVRGYHIAKDILPDLESYGSWENFKDIAPNVVHVMLITRRPDGVAYRVAITGINEDEWRAANPTKSHLILA